jgi:hypothetical protein
MTHLIVSIILEHPSWLRGAQKVNPCFEECQSFLLPGQRPSHLEAHTFRGLFPDFEKILRAQGFWPDSSKEFNGAST